MGLWLRPVPGVQLRKRGYEAYRGGKSEQVTTEPV